MTDRDIAERLRMLADEWSLRSYTVSHALHESADAIDALRESADASDWLRERAEKAEVGLLNASREIGKWAQAMREVVDERDALQAALGGVLWARVRESWPVPPQAEIDAAWSRARYAHHRMLHVDPDTGGLNAARAQEADRG